jgi:uncharacterized RDD family membrane protein YckC
MKTEATIRDVTTPEGVSLPFDVASAVDRVTAFFIDFAIIVATVVVLLLIGLLAWGTEFGGVALSFALLSSFFVRNFYFIFFEMRWGGSTPGKRTLGLRVISRDGGPLTAEAVFARNLTRDIEVFLPLTALAEPRALLPGLPVWAAMLGSLWLMLFALVPLLSNDRLRIGDIVAGTLVVRMPKAALMEDLTQFPAGTYAARFERQRTGQSLVFSRSQLDLYGIKELQVLESVLRKGTGEEESEVMHAVAERIKTKIAWPREDWDVDSWEFLNAFYKAQRARLEHKMLFGIRQEEKRAGGQRRDRPRKDVP